MNGSSETALHIACKNGHLLVAKSLVKLKVKHDGLLNYQDRRGNTPLHHCVLNGNYELAKLLIRNDANLDIKNVSGKTPREEAIEMNHLAVLSLLQQGVSRSKK